MMKPRRILKQSNMRKIVNQIAKKFAYSSIDLLSLLVLTILWIVSIYIVNPSGNFPLNDDWAYARGIKTLVQDGQMVLDNWPAMTLIAQIGMGTIYCKLFGFSFEVLRWSTLVNSLLCCGLFYFILRKITTLRLTLFTSLVLFFNPIFFSLSFTFMTEVHFILALMGIFLFFSNYIETSKYSYLILATMFSVIATLIRQPGLLAPFAFALILFVNVKSNRTRIVVLLPFLISLISLQIYYYWQALEFPHVDRVGGLMDLIGSLSSQELESLSDRITNFILIPGLFLSPLILLLLPSINWEFIKNKKSGVSLILIFVALLLFNLDSFPSGNVFYNLGLGPKLIKGVTWNHSNMDPSLSQHAWNSLDYIALFSVFGGALMILKNNKLSGSIFKVPIDTITQIKWSVALFCLFYFIVAVLLPSSFDRYALPLIPCLAILILPRKRINISNVSNTVATIALIIFALFSIAATHDYLSWNRARNEAFTYLNQVENIPPQFIDAGFEINGWLQAGPDGSSDSNKSWWFVTEDDFAITFDNQPGYRDWKAFPFKTYIFPYQDTIYIIKKDHIRELGHFDYPIICDFENTSEDQKYIETTNPKIKFPFTSLISDEIFRSGNHALKLTPSDEYSLTVKFWDFKPADIITISLWRFSKESDIGIVVDSEYQNSFYNFNTERVVEESENGWEKLETEITIPTFHGQDRVSIYIWNHAEENVWIDDIRIGKKVNKKEAIQ